MISYFSLENMSKLISEENNMEKGMVYYVSYVTNIETGNKSIEHLEHIWAHINIINISF